MTSEDIGIVRTVFKWNDQERMFIAKPIDVMRLDTASISNLKALAGEGTIKQESAFSFKMPVKSENLFWSKTEIEEFRPPVKEDSDTAVYASMMALAVKHMENSVKAASYAGSIWEICGFLDDLCTSSEEWNGRKQDYLDQIADFKEDQGAKFSLPGEDLSAIYDCTVEIPEKQTGKVWLEWRVDEDCLFEKDEAKREQDRQESLREAVRRIIAVAVKRDEMKHLSFS